jgi:hypothetical protein
MSEYYSCETPHGDTVTIICGPGRPIAYTKHEGGEWFACPDGKGPFPAAVLFDDGSIFDTILHGLGVNGGWRKLQNHKPRIRIKMGSTA